MKAVEKFNARAEWINSLVCVGLDSDLLRLPALFQQRPHPQFEFNRHMRAYFKANP